MEVAKTGRVAMSRGQSARATVATGSEATDHHIDAAVSFSV
jgi:hypothetical protein